MTTRKCAILMLCGCVLAFGSWSRAQDNAAPAAASDGGQIDLATRQEQVADRFEELERLLLRMAELTSSTDPRRAALLRRAVAQSKNRAIGDQFDELVELLRQERLAPVVKNQEAVQDELVRLLELLLSEDRTKRIKSEKERVRDYLKRVNKIIREQRGVQGETRRADDPTKLADRQGDLSEKTGELAEDVNENEGGSSGKSRDSGEAEQGSDESQPGDKDSEKDKTPGDESETPGEKGEPNEGEDSQGDSEKAAEGEKGGEPSDESDEKSESQEGSGGKPSQGQPNEAPPVPPAESQQSQGQGQPGQPSQQNPAEQRLKQAQERMREAQQKLEEAKRSDANEKQAEALKELEQAKAELEEILRQLREEEKSRTLAMLESRFRKMLDAQIEVNEGTTRLDGVPADERDRDDNLEAGRLGRKEAEIAVEADKALDVLREEGSAVAFPEAVIGIRDDMITVRDRLAEAEVGELTQSIEQDIVTALEEMIAALQKAQKDAENDTPPPPGGEPGSGEFEMPLVDTLSELKMIRALQMRVNVRTKRYAEMAETEAADRPALLEALDQLAERERRIHKVTRDIVVGRNR